MGRGREREREREIDSLKMKKRKYRGGDGWKEGSLKNDIVIDTEREDGTRATSDN